ncbi:MAG: hypothetical protein EHM58_00230 [Ignavibacteriae bacterium]|nr:MAG: hypothetical protein EHM58_00230 [Ignavibacteriota bacterium]
MINWILNFFGRLRLKRQKNDPNKVDLAVKQQKTYAINEILHYSDAYMKKLQNVYSRMQKRYNKLKGILKSTEVIEENTKQDKKNTYEFTEYEIQKVKSLNRFYYFIVTLFIIAEIGLYYLTASVFVPPQLEALKIVLALFLATVVMVVLNYSFDTHFKYREMQQKKEENKISEHILKNYKDTRNLGYVLTAVSFLIIITAGLVRIYFLEQTDTTGYTAEEIQSNERIGFWASILTMAITFALGIFMALVKRNQFTNKLKYKLWKKWRETVTKIHEHDENRKNLLSTFNNEIKKTIEKFWQLVLDVRRIYKLECDQNKDKLHEEYKKERLKPGFSINDSVYIKYDSIQSVDEKLFKYGILNADAIKEKMEEIRKNEEIIIQLVEEIKDLKSGNKSDEKIPEKELQTA